MIKGKALPKPHQRVQKPRVTGRSAQYILGRTACKLYVTIPACTAQQDTFCCFWRVERSSSDRKGASNVSV